MCFFRARNIKQIIVFLLFKTQIESKIIISSAPLREVALNIFPELNSRLEANKLKYRDYIIVALLLKNKPVFDDNWIAPGEIFTCNMNYCRSGNDRRRLRVGVK